MMLTLLTVDCSRRQQSTVNSELEFTIPMPNGFDISIRFIRGLSLGDYQNTAKDL